MFVVWKHNSKTEIPTATEILPTTGAEQTTTSSPITEHHGRIVPVSRKMDNGFFIFIDSLLSIKPELADRPDVKEFIGTLKELGMQDKRDQRKF